MDDDYAGQLLRLRAFVVDDYLNSWIRCWWRFLGLALLLRGTIRSFGSCLKNGSNLLLTMVGCDDGGFVID